MAAPFKLLSAVLLLSIFAIGNAQQCALSTLIVNQRNTGDKSGFDLVFEVEVQNRCQCTVTNVFLHSLGFISSMPVDPKLFRQQGRHYLVNDGNSIPSSTSAKFQYAWDHAFEMSPASFNVAC